ncbi:MAG: site-specific DNA-methyltransferase, partial [Planctomycetes bacterium]|nr:site-specific DNA-methyltransferase [Planctomycetota bacterium]
GEWQVKLEGVDIYDPVENTVRSTKAEKVAAWFLDSDFDGRCFCICQAFFPDQDAWEKIAKSLGSAADPEAFAAFKGTTSLAFKKGRHGRIAVKVIDPRGNEVMTVRKLEG